MLPSAFDGEPTTSATQRVDGLSESWVWRSVSDWLKRMSDNSRLTISTRPLSAARPALRLLSVRAAKLACLGFEDGLQDILRHLETQHASFAALTESSRNAAAPPDSGLVDIVKRELSDIRFSQSETDRHTQDSLEAVHNTLGHVVDRLAIIEGDLRNVRIRAGCAAAGTAAGASARPAAGRRAARRVAAAGKT